MTQPRSRLGRPARQLTDISMSSCRAKGHRLPLTPRCLGRSITLPSRCGCMSLVKLLLDYESALARHTESNCICRRAPRDMSGAEHISSAATPASQFIRPSLDPSILESATPSSASHDFRRSPLGRSVVTALEAQLERVRCSFAKQLWSMYCMHALRILCDVYVESPSQKCSR